MDRGEQIQDDKAYQPKFLLLDHLGTTRAELKFVEDEDTGEITPTISTGYDYMPYGELITEDHLIEALPGNPDPRTEQVLFTGKPRDKESGLDYFGARFYGNHLLRWTSPDQPFVDNYISSPQKWNLYSYVSNNPITAVDREGLLELRILATTTENKLRWDVTFNVSTNETIRKLERIPLIGFIIKKASWPAKAKRACNAVIGKPAEASFDDAMASAKAQPNLKERFGSMDDFETRIIENFNPTGDINGSLNGNDLNALQGAVNKSVNDLFAELGYDDGVLSPKFGDELQSIKDSLLKEYSVSRLIGDAIENYGQRDILIDLLNEFSPYKIEKTPPQEKSK